jgi:hypothetical protein
MSGIRQPAAPGNLEIVSMDEILKSVAAPLTVVALRLEQARLSLSRGQDPAAALRSAREELDRAFDAFEKGRARLFGQLTLPEQSQTSAVTG